MPMPIQLLEMKSLYDAPVKFGAQDYGILRQIGAENASLV